MGHFIDVRFGIVVVPSRCYNLRALLNMRMFVDCDVELLGPHELGASLHAILSSKAPAISPMTANNACALNNWGGAPGQPGRRVGSITQPEATGRSARVIPLDVTAAAGGAYA
jgi:hypothetical protein